MTPCFMHVLSQKYVYDFSKLCNENHTNFKCFAFQLSHEYCPCTAYKMKFSVKDFLCKKMCYVMQKFKKSSLRKFLK